MDNSYYNRLTEKSASDGRNCFTKGNCRFSIISSKLIRVEKSGGDFCNEPTQTVICRNFGCPSYVYSTHGSIVEIKTNDIDFFYDTNRNRFVRVVLSDGRTATDCKTGNLGGTCRTLDNTSGEFKLDSKTGRINISDGIISTNGIAVLDDSASLILCPDGEIRPRAETETDKYFFAYGWDYRAALEDFFKLTGHPVLIPRYALGNWWSRYKAYTQEEYETLIDRFAEEKIPLTVATIDMDWHETDVINKFGKDAKDKYLKLSPYELVYLFLMPGWTGYTWNKDLFPQPQEFLKGLQDRGLKVTMNLHPHSGCRFFEDEYNEFADFMGVDKKNREQILFDITDPKFREGYFKYLHHPHENDGVDFWWIDWQQSHHTATPGLDPLWALNHYHTIDNARDGKRPLILSRFAGAGSHRYPLGFSGDTFQTWESLNTQPEFTARASNIGYTWWSHDIGGHCFGKRDDELYLRWVQFGVFSPVNRLHSTANEFMGKEPWKFGSSVRIYATDMLRFRHRLIPYLYTMNRLTATKGLALCEPMYYGNPKDERAYGCPNEYRFGTELICAPITERTNPKTGLSSTMVFLPKGRYADIFTGRVYTGNKVVTMYRDLSSIPVLAKEGAIIPLDDNDRKNYCGNPEKLDVWVYRGNGNFKLYEDDGESFEFENGAFAETEFTVKENGNDLEFSIDPVKGNKAVLPEKREIRVIFRDIKGFGEAVLYKDDKKSKDCHTEIIDGNAVLILRAYSPDAEYKLILKAVTVKANPPKKEQLIELISKYQTGNNAKMLKYTDFVLKGKKIKLPKELEGPIAEINED